MQVFLLHSMTNFAGYSGGITSGAVSIAPAAKLVLVVVDDDDILEVPIVERSKSGFAAASSTSSSSSPKQKRSPALIGRICFSTSPPVHPPISLLNRAAKNVASVVESADVM